MKVDKDFLEKHLTESITTFSSSPGTNPGDNVAGSLESIKVTLTSGKTLHLVNKTIPDHPDAKEFLVNSQVFLTEIGAYESLMPRLEAHIRAKTGKDISYVPRYFGGNPDITGEATYLLLEDIRPQGYKMQDKFETYNFPEVRLILEKLGEFHASTYSFMRFEGEKIFDEPGMKKLRDNHFSAKDPISIASGKAMFGSILDVGVSILQELGHSDEAEWVKKTFVDSNNKTAFDLVRSRSQRTDASTFSCIIHGDFWVNNIMIKYDKDGQPIEAKFLDLQQTRRGNIYEELIYFIFTSTKRPFRENHLLQALNVYYESFISTLVKLDCPKPLGFSRGNLIDTFYEEILGGFAFMFFAIPLQLTLPLNRERELEIIKEYEKTKKPTPPPTLDANVDPAAAQMGMIMHAIAQKMGSRCQVLKAQMMVTPRATNRLLELTKEAIDMELLSPV